MILAQIRGLHLDLALSNERQRADRAMQRYIDMITTQHPTAASARPPAPRAARQPSGFVQLIGLRLRHRPLGDPVRMLGGSSGVAPDELVERDVVIACDQHVLFARAGPLPERLLHAC